MTSKIKHTSRYMIAAVAFLVFSGASVGNETTSPDIQVELTSQNPPALHVTVRSRAETRVSFFKWRLPWGNTNTMILVAVASDRNYIKRNIPIDDPSPERVSMEPNESLSGDVRLDNAFSGFDTALKRSDIHLFWAYEAPKELHIAPWSGGWILIPQQK
jgi:hypothetical protein